MLKCRGKEQAMATAVLPDAASEVAQLGETIYERDLRPLLETDHAGEVVAIDVHTGAYEVAADVLASGLRLRARLPEAAIWFVRIGQSAVHRLPRRTPLGRK
jgi:hypothetical protein